MKIAGLDVGTTGCKCTVFDENGKYLNKAYRECRPSRYARGHEVDAGALLDAAIECISQMAEEYPDIAGIGVTSFGETFVFTDESGTPLHPAMLYTDPRGEDQCKQLIDSLGEMHIAEITGLRPHEMYSISKMMWVRDNLPEVFKKARHMFEIEDFLVYHLSGVAQIDYSLASRSMAFDITKLDWSDEILRAAGMDRSLFPKPVPTGTVAGPITADMAAKCGLKPDTVIVSISHDQVAAAVGAGAFDGSVAVDGAGTVQCLTPIYDEKPDVAEMYKGYFSVVPYVLPGKYVAYAFSYTGGALVQWCTDTVKGQEATADSSTVFGQGTTADSSAAAQNKPLSDNEYLEKKYAERMTLRGARPDSPSGLLVLPHFAGAATPYMDTGSKGAILGLSTATSPEEIYYACLEGVCYEMYLNYKHLSNTGVHFEKLHATGGGAHSAVWMQMKSDMLNMPIVALKTVDAGTVGSAMLTGIAIGVFDNLTDAAEHMVEKTTVYEPRQELHEQYMKLYCKYEKVYEAVRPLM